MKNKVKRITEANTSIIIKTTTTATATNVANMKIRQRNNNYTTGITHTTGSTNSTKSSSNINKRQRFLRNAKCTFKMTAKSFFLTMLATVILGMDLALSSTDIMRNFNHTSVNSTATTTTTNETNHMQKDSMPVTPSRFSATMTNAAVTSSDIAFRRIPPAASEIPETINSKYNSLATTTTRITTQIPAMSLLTLLINNVTTSSSSSSSTTFTEFAADEISTTTTSETPESPVKGDFESTITLTDDNDTLHDPHSADSLTKGFSIPTFLPPFPEFAMADLPALLSAGARAATGADNDNVSSNATSSLSSSHATSSSSAGVEQASNLPNLIGIDGYRQHERDQLYLTETADKQQQQQKQQETQKKNVTVPTFNVTVQAGNHAYMPCHLNRLMNKPVSWVRLRDGHILSVDQTTFIADQRFQTIFKGDNEHTWSLQIKYVQASDEGWYECQVATEPKMSAKTYLSVVVPITELIGDQNRFVKAGSKVALHCIVRGTLEPPTYIIWFRGDKQITEDKKSGWYTQLDRNIFGDTTSNQNTIGSLIIPFVQKKDSGNYTCQPSNSAAVSVDLHVLSGEYSASAIMSSASTNTLNIYHLPLMLLLLLLPFLLCFLVTSQQNET